MKTPELTDESPMPFGKHKGVAMANVPADYLIWLYDSANAYGAIKTYIEDNLDGLRTEVLNARSRLK